jgi:Bax protein
MDRINKLWPAILGVGVLLIVMIAYQFLASRLEAPNFASIENATERQEVFFKYFGRSTQQLNAQIMGDREKIEKLAASPSTISTQAGWLKSRAALYGITGDISPAFFDALLSRADVVPPGLVLPEAALASGWGTSYEAIEGNNFFALKCFQKNCGLVPRDRAPGQTFEMATFDTPYDSVNNYIFNLNTKDNYAQLRKIRAQLRKTGQPLTGYALAEGLGGALEKDSDYVRKVRDMIRTNHLDETYGLLPESSRK